MPLMKDLMKYRLPVLVGAGGIVAYTTFQRAQAAKGAAIAAAATAAPATASPGGISAEQALALQQNAYAAGGGLGLQGAQLGLQTADKGLDLAMVATGAVQAALGDVVGLGGTLGNALAGVSQTAIGALPDLSPTPQPAPVVNVVLPAPAPAPAPSGTGTAPAPAPTFVGYEVVIPAAGTYPIFTISATAGGATARRLATFSGPSRASVARVTTPYLHWRTTAGGYTGWSYVPGQSGNFTIRRVYKSATGAITYVTIGQKGS